MKILLALLTALLLSPLAALQADEPTSVREPPLAFVQKHCLDCHNASTSEGGFRADLLGGDLADAANHKAWSRVLARVQSGEMPPPRREQ